MSPIALTFLIGTIQFTWQLTPPSLKSEVTNVGDHFAHQIARAAEESDMSVGDYVFMSILAAANPPIPNFEDTAYSIEHIQGLTDAQIVGKFGRPHWDSRDLDDGNDSFFFVYYEPGGFLGWRALIEFENRVVTHSRHVSR